MRARPEAAHSTPASAHFRHGGCVPCFSAPRPSRSASNRSFFTKMPVSRPFSASTTGSVTFSATVSEEKSAPC